MTWLLVILENLCLKMCTTRVSYGDLFKLYIIASSYLRPSASSLHVHPVKCVWIPITAVPRIIWLFWTEVSGLIPKDSTSRTSICLSISAQLKSLQMTGNYPHGRLSGESVFDHFNVDGTRCYIWLLNLFVSFLVFLRVYIQVHKDKRIFLVARLTEINF